MAVRAIVNCGGSRYAALTGRCGSGEESDLPWLSSERVRAAPDASAGGHVRVVFPSRITFFKCLLVYFHNSKLTVWNVE
jgi:hypothetical protein